MSCLALLGGQPALTSDPVGLFDWPIITREDEEAVLYEFNNTGKTYAVWEQA